MMVNDNNVGEVRPEKPARPRPDRIALVAWAAILAAAASFAAYQQAFCTFAAYDDEGYVMMSLRNVMRGKPLYDETYSQYGPAYYAIHGTIHRIWNIPISHDVVRLKMVAQWIAIATVSMFTVYRLTDSKCLAAVGFISVFCFLDRLCLEPGHPQEMCALAVAVLLFAGTFVRVKQFQILGLAAIGVLIGVVILTKLNVGILLLVAVMAAMANNTQTSKNEKRFGICFWAVLSVGCLLPLSISAKHGANFAAHLLPTIVVAAIALAAIAIRKRARLRVISPPGWIAFTAALLSTATAIAIWTVLSGTSVAAMLDGVVFQHFGFVNEFYRPAPLTAVAIPLAAIALCGAIALRDSKWFTPALRFGAVLILAAVLVQVFVESTSPLRTGLENRGHAGLVASIAPLIGWVILLPRSHGCGISVAGCDPEKNSFARQLLYWVASLQLLIAYPIPGTQMAVGVSPWIIICLVATSDLMQVKMQFKIGNVNLARPVVAGSLLALAIATLIHRDVQNWLRRSQLEPLGLPGASALRLEPDRAQTYRRLSEHLRQNCDTFVFRENTDNSFYFWTGIEPPTALNATTWPFMLDSDQQQQTVDVLERIERVAVVSREFDWPLPVHNAPLTRYIAENFCPDRSLGAYQVWTRKRRINRPVTLLETPRYSPE
jgi:hypothetical protein